MDMNRGTVPLETERLLLRRFEIGDAGDMFHTWANDEEVTKFMRWSAHKSVAETEQVVMGWVQNYVNDDCYHWAITIKATNALIGTIGMFCVSRHDMCYEVGYCVGREYWNNGYMTEALTAVLQFGLKQEHINRIEAYHSVNNPASGKVMQKAA